MMKLSEYISQTLHHMSSFPSNCQLSVSTL